MRPDENMLLLNFFKEGKQLENKIKGAQMDWSGSSEAVLIVICIYVMLLIKGAFHKGTVSSELPHGAWLQRRRAQESWGSASLQSPASGSDHCWWSVSGPQGWLSFRDLLGAVRRHLCPHWSVGKRVTASHVRTPSGDITRKPNQGTDDIHTQTHTHTHTPWKLLEIRRTYLSLSFLLTVHLPRPKFLTVFAFPKFKLFLSLFSRWETSHMHTNMLKNKTSITGPLSFVFASTVLDTW